MTVDLKLQKSILINYLLKLSLNENHRESGDLEKEVRGLEEYFSETTLPKNPIALTKYLTIINVMKYVKSHLTLVKSYNGTRIGQPYLDRLRALKNHIEKTK